MVFNSTLGYVKKRILDMLDEYTGTGEVFVVDSNREVLLSRIPDAVNSSLVRMFESLPIGETSGLLHINKPRKLLCEKKDGYYELTAENGKAAVVLGYFGRGKMLMQDSNENIVAEIECSDMASLSYKREIITIESGGRYRLLPTDGLIIKDIALYGAKETDDVNCFPPNLFYSCRLPQNFDKFVCVKNGKDELYAENEICGEYSYFPARFCKDAETLSVVYSKKAPVITADTEDGFEFDMSALALEALICLAASELCTENSADEYSRLYYKYMDLSEGLYKSRINHGRKNSFYIISSKRR